MNGDSSPVIILELIFISSCHFFKHCPRWAASPCYMHWNSDLCRRLLTPLSCPAYSTLHVFAREICEWFFVRVSSYIQWFSVVLWIRKWNETPWRVSLQTSGFWDRGEGHMEKRQEPQWPQCLLEALALAIGRTCLTVHIHLTSKWTGDTALWIFVSSGIDQGK